MKRKEIAQYCFISSEKKHTGSIEKVLNLRVFIQGGKRIFFNILKLRFS